MHNKKKVVLFYPIINPQTQYFWFPFSILVLGSTLKHFGYEPVIIDERLNPDYKDLLLKNMEDALCFGTSAMSGYQIRGGLIASKIVKEYFPNVPVVWGGRHPTLLPLQTLQHPFVDIVVVGQGEITFSELVTALEQKTQLDTVEGIAFKMSKDIILNPEREICDIRKLHGFAWDLIDIQKYINPDTRAVAYFSSFGCPNRCGFCINSSLDQKWMSQEVTYTLGDLEYLIKTYDFRNMIFQDSNFFVSKKRVEMLARGFIERRFNVKWKGSIRVDQLCKYDTDFLNLLQESGLTSLFIGVESGSQKILDLMTKDTQVEDAIRSVESTKNFDFDMHLSFMFGLPYETVDDLKKTIEHIKEIKKINPRVRVQTCFYSPFPSTPLYNMAVDLGYSPPRSLTEWQYIKEQTEFNLPVWFSDEMSKEYEKVFHEFFKESLKTYFNVRLNNSSM